jgi:hypothetical protein
MNQHEGGERKKKDLRRQQTSRLILQERSAIKNKKLLWFLDSPPEVIIKIKATSCPFSATAEITTCQLADSPFLMTDSRSSTTMQGNSFMMSEALQTGEKFIGRNREGLALSISDHMCERVGGGPLFLGKGWGSLFQTRVTYFL